METLKKFSDKKISSEKNFGLSFSTIFILITLYIYFKYNIIIKWLILVSIILIFFSFFKPNFLKIPNILWNKLGYILGAIVSPLVMGIIFFGVVTPTGIIIKLKKFFLNFEKRKIYKTYWVINKEKKSSLKNQF